MTPEQLTIDARTEVDVRRLPLPDRWALFKAGNPHVLPELARITRRLRDRGIRVSIARVFEEARLRVVTSGDPRQLDNSYRAFAARELMQTYPDLRGVFETRRSKADR